MASKVARSKQTGTQIRRTKKERALIVIKCVEK